MSDAPRPPGRVLRPALAAVTAMVLLGAGFGLYLFAPWKAFTDTTVNEALPAAPAAAPAASAPAPTATAAAAPAQPVDLARGSFRSGEHTTTGTARIVRLPDGTAVLRLEDLDTSEGPDVRVYLSTLPAEQSHLSSLGDGPIELDRLKGNHGNQNYAIPPGTDLAAVHSAVIWCKRFSVGFGAADLTAL
ncbi:DM13 domain-containing protein [Kitasatospora sp. NPDC048540]|uniref:DM13 domain-containing protein n=1 Tax=unclassified Kitasatospora TaxID=2633591 RepID=UPI00053B7622|nr:DM13 domain-containing protein [Kitasatospora sp. MBT63]